MVPARRRGCRAAEVGLVLRARGSLDDEEVISPMQRKIAHGVKVAEIASGLKAPIWKQQCRKNANQHESSSSVMQHTDTAHRHSTQSRYRHSTQSQSQHKHSAVTVTNQHESSSNVMMQTTRHGTVVTALVEASEGRFK